MSAMPGISRQFLDQPRQVAAHQRLAAGNAELRDAQRRGHAHETLDLFEAEDLLAFGVLHALFRHAVEAADIAAVGNADAQVIVDDGQSCR